MNPCEDVLNNCTNLPPENCCGPYEPWSHAHCARYCGFCGQSPPPIMLRLYLTSAYLFSTRKTSYPLLGSRMGVLCMERRKHGAVRPQTPVRLIRDGEVGGREFLYLTPTGYTVTTKMTVHYGGQLSEPF